MAQTQISIDADMLARLDATSLANSISREQALREAIANYCEYDRWFRSSVQRGLDDIRDGRVLSHEAVEREAEALLALYRREEN